MRWAAGFSTLLALAGFAGDLPGQVTRRSYYEQIPPAPKLVGQTRASAELLVFGDRTLASYIDAVPRDGIDDARAARLTDLAERFSPILRRNNFSVPRDFRGINGTRLVMHADRWLDGMLCSSDSVDLRCCGSPSAGGAPQFGEHAANDDKLVALLEAFDPRLPEPRFHDAGARRETVLYFDFPGENEKTWRRAYKDFAPLASTVFVHPFIHDDDSGSERPFALVLQFWFFYPFNDSANNHEGDWEHLNVAITTLARAAMDSTLPAARGGLSVQDIERLLSAAGGFPLDSLTIRFPATWRAIGPVGASEKVSGEVAPRVREPSDSIAWHDLIEDTRYLTYRRGSIHLLPDWERVIDAIHEDAAVRRDWAWLVLPVHFGYPASQSPGGGAVSRTDLGNVSPTGPAFDPGWNRAFTSTEYHAFDPHVLRIAFAPVSPFTGLQNGWGILNVPIALAGLIPGMQVVTAQLMPWATGALGILGAPPGKTFYAGKLPNRFTSFGAGRFVQFGGDDFARLLPHAEDDSIASFLAPSAHIDNASYRRYSSDGNRVWILLHYGNSVAIENTFSVDTTRLRYSIRDSSGATVGIVRGQLAMRQLSSGIRFSRRLFTDEVRGYARAGYTWTWYSISHRTLNGHPVESATTRAGHAPSVVPSTKWWPNSAYAGAGLELFAPRRAWMFGRLGYGLAAEMNVIAFPMRSTGCRCLVMPGDASIALLFGW